MANDLNRLIISGRLGADPTVFTTQNGGSIIEANVAVNTRTKSKGDAWAEETFWINAKLFGNRGEAFVRFHSKGSKVLLQGEIRQERWTDKHTQKERSKLIMRVDDWFFTSDGNGRKQNRAGGYDAPSSSQGTFDAANDDFSGIDNTPF